MPNGNKSITLQSRLQKAARSLPQESHNIVGSKEWAYTQYRGNNIKYNPKKARESFFSAMNNEEKQKYLSTIPKKFTNSQKFKNEQFIDNISAWIDGNGWQYIEGGENHGNWVNPHYPNQMFKGGVSSLPVTNGMETVEYPISSFNDDPHGIACHIKISCAGSRKEVCPNKWTDILSTRRGKKQKRSADMHVRRYVRWQAYSEANEIKDVMHRNDAIAGLKMKFHKEDVERQQKKMGYTDEQIAAAN